MEAIGANGAVTTRRTKQDFAHQRQRLVDEAFPEAEGIRVILDNLNLHRAAASYGAFPPAQARRILRRLEFHCTPIQGSWLDMVEEELRVS